MATLDLSTVTQYPWVSSTATPGTANLCSIILLPINGSLQITLHNRDKATKDLAFSFDQTLTDGGPAPATYMIVDGNGLTIKCGPNRRTGFASIVKVAVFSPAHTDVPCEILLEENGL
jgi:hypothetical protein